MSRGIHLVDRSPGVARLKAHVLGRPEKLRHLATAISPSSITSPGTITGEAFVATTDVGEVALQVPSSTYVCLRAGGLDCIYSNGSRLILPSGVQSAANSGSNALQMDNGAQVDFGNGSDDHLYGDGSGILTPGRFTAGSFASADTKVRGSISTDLSGNGTATVNAGAYCVCSGKNNPVNVCSLTGTTLTVQASAASDPVQYICML